uniref:Protocadherin gamma-C3 n=1 Tax=Strix occidentalis caurina TaxID=311401 RepID=A0A8D0FBC1_STROC
GCAEPRAPPASSAQIRYSIPEELTRGAFVGNIAKDLGTDVAKLAAANLQVLSDSDSQYFSVNVNTGVIMVSERIDREQLCGQNPRCFLHLKLAIENPVEFYRIEVEILDINDNPPEFPSDEVSLRIYELASLGARFPIQPAQDPDVGTNTLQTYHLSANENFNLNVKARTDGGKFPELVLERALDRELRAFHHLVLTAEDGGSPPQSSKIRITIQVLDANDNHPVFDRPSYGARLVENSPLGTLVVKLNATDVDEGPNGDIRYSLSSHNSAALRQIFAIDEQTGEIRVQGNLDFEEATVYEIEVEAKDMGSPTMEEHCSVVVEITDVNDNAPEVILTSFSSSLSEDAPPGTVVAVIHVRDRDSGEQGRVQCHVSPDLPFQLRKDYEHQYSLLTSTRLDREHVAYYNVTISASDLGSPPLSRHTTLPIALADVNDNAPQFEQASYEVLVAENNPVGSVLVTVSAADPDSEQNSRLSYSILRDVPISTYFRIDQDNGTIYTMRALDYEQDKVFQVPVEVKDAGSPALSSTAVVHVFVLDENDNAPTIVYPSVPKGSAFHQTIPVLAEPGYLVTKIVAVDADSGHNYLDVGRAGLTSQAQNYTSCFSPMSDQSDFLFNRGIKTTLLFSPQQAQPNTDWRFSQTQRPGTSGSQNGEEGGAWPNNQFDTEMLQAMILASANEAADGNSTLGGGTGTMGLSARYGPQFTLQHVPDYRQNVYIPGSTATLTNAAGKRDAKNSGSSGGNKKKSGKKEKK